MMVYIDPIGEVIMMEDWMVLEVVGVILRVVILVMIIKEPIEGIIWVIMNMCVI